MKAILLTQGQACFVDDEDYEVVSKKTWYAAKTKNGNYYAQGRFGSKIVQMQRVIMGAAPGVLVDHRNRDTLDNRRINLRLSDYSGNRHNSPSQQNGGSKFKGVSWNKRLSKWAATISSKPKICLGYFNDEKSAAYAYDSAAREMYGDTALTNFNHITVPTLTLKQRRDAIQIATPRIKVHWRVASPPESPSGKLTQHFSHNGDNLTIRQWSQRSGIKLRTLRGRIYERKMDIATALSMG